MNIYEFLHTPTLVTPHPVPTGHASTPEELLGNCIPIDLKDKNLVDSIIKWHKLLVRYVNSNPNPVFLSRLYESAGSSGAWDTRRGSLTVCKNCRYAFASNHFARIIYTMAINCFVPTDKDFADMLNNMKFSLFYEHRLTPIEKKIAAYTNIPYDHPYYTPNWYLAHIISVNDCPYFNHEHLSVRDIFQIGTESDWIYNNKLDRMVRTSDVTLTPGELEVAKAHFLRFVDPINHFLVPGKNFVVYNKQHEDDGAPLGENKYVLDVMALEAHRAFGKYFGEFMKEALVDPDYIKVIESRYKANQTIDAHYSTNPFTSSERKSKTVTLKKSSSTKAAKSTTKKPASAATTKDYSTYMFEGVEYQKRPLVLAVVKSHVRKRGITTFAELQTDFPDNLMGAKGVVKRAKDIADKDKGIGGIARYYSDPTQVITLAGEEVMVCNQWTLEKIDLFIKHAEKLGHLITKI